MHKPKQLRETYPIHGGITVNKDPKFDLRPELATLGKDTGDYRSELEPEATPEN
jgi:hypothetical protein